MSSIKDIYQITHADYLAVSKVSFQLQSDITRAQFTVHFAWQSIKHFKVKFRGWGTGSGHPELMSSLRNSSANELLTILCSVLQAVTKGYKRIAAWKKSREKKAKIKRCQSAKSG